MAVSKELCALRDCYDVLVRGIQDNPEGLADVLFSHNVITHTLRDEVYELPETKEKKSRRLLVAVENKIAIDPGTFETFLSILKEEPTLKIVADRLQASYDHQMEESCSAHLPHGRHWHTSTAVSQFAAYLQALYDCRAKPVGKGISTPSKHYINLAVISKEDIGKKDFDEFTQLTIHGKVDDILKKKTEIKLHQIGRQDDGSFARCVLVEGAPGVGKTTLAWELCRRWKEILKDFDVVLLLTLRDKSIQEAKCLFDLIKHYDINEELKERVCSELTNGQSLLMILEGYDEMPQGIQKDSLFSKIVEGTRLPCASVLVTTRPSSGHILHEKCLSQKYQHIEVVGFTSKDVDSYIQDVMGNDEDSMRNFYEYLHRHPHIHKMMYNPLNCGLTVKCYKYYNDSNVALNTQTELYTNVTKMLVINELSGTSKHAHFKECHISGTLSNLPRTIHRKLLDLSKFAYESIVRNEIIFRTLPSHLDSLGLLQKSKDVHIPDAFSYNFSHLTIQEFLAAYHISFLRSSQQAQCIDIHLQEDHMQMVLRFIAGLTKFKVSGFLESIISVFGRTPRRCLQSYFQSSEFFLEAIHWLFESQDKQLVQDTIGLQTYECILSGQTLDPFNCYALGYCIQNSECQWRLNLKNCCINDEGGKMLCCFSLNQLETLDLSGNKAPDLGGLLSTALWSNHVLSDLRLEGCGINEEKMAQLTDALCDIPSLHVLDLSQNDVGVKAAGKLRRCSQNLTQLFLVACRITDPVIRELAPGLHYSGALKELWLQANPIGEQGAFDLAEMVKKNKTLHSLSLLGCGLISNSGATALVQSLLCNHTLKHLQLSEAFQTHCKQNVENYNQVVDRVDWCDDFTQLSVVEIKHKFVNCEVLGHALRGNTALTELRLVNCDIDDLDQLRRALRDSPTLAALDLSGTIGNSGLKILAQWMTESTVLTRLELRESGISANGAPFLTQRDNSVLQHLDLSGNKLGSEGANLIAQALTENTTLTHLDLSECKISADGLASLSSSLRNKSVFQNLNLSGNKFGSTGAEYLAQALIENTTLTHLDLSRCEISADGLASLSSSLRNKSVLQNLNLSGNKFGSNGAEHLAQALRENTTLTHLDLSQCEISADGLAFLSSSLRNRSVLKNLNLSGNDFGSKGAEHLAQALTENTTLTHLDLSRCEISADGLAFLSPSLRNKSVLQNLNLSGNKFGSNGAEHLAQALTENTTLTHLDLSQCDISADGLAFLSSSLSVLQNLNLSGNDFGSKGAEHLAQALAENTTLTHLDLSKCEIGAFGLASMPSLLRNRSVLQNLNLSGNFLGSKGAEDLAQALTENTTLTHLDLSRCEISADGLAFLSSSLRNRSVLQSLNLSENKFGSKGAEHLADALRENTSVLYVDMSCCGIDLRGVTLLKTVQVHRPSLRIKNYQ